MNSIQFSIDKSSVNNSNNVTEFLSINDAELLSKKSEIFVDESSVFQQTRVQCLIIDESSSLDESSVLQIYESSVTPIRRKFMHPPDQARSGLVVAVLLISLFVYFSPRLGLAILFFNGQSQPWIEKNKQTNQQKNNNNKT